MGLGIRPTRTGPGLRMREKAWAGGGHRAGITSQLPSLVVSMHGVILGSGSGWGTPGLARY